MNIPFVQANSSNYKKGRTATIQWIVVHYTANDGDTDAGNASYFARTPNLSASAHYFVDEDSVTQSVRDSDTAWHCGASTYYNGCRNANSIGVEMCSDKVNGKYVITEQTVARTAELVRMLMQKYGIPVSRVCRHYDVTHKQCPEPWVRNPQLWEDFKKRLTQKEDDEVIQNKTVLVDGKEYKCECIEKDGHNFVKMRSLSQAGYDVVFDAARQLPAMTAPQCRAFVPEGDEAVQDAIDTLQEVCGLEEQTIQYLLKYHYGDDLVKKLAKAVQGNA